MRTRADRRGLLLAAISILALSTGCSGSEQPAGESGARVVDGHYCGYLSTQLVEDYLGHEDVTAQGDLVADRAERAKGVATCTVKDSRSSINIGVRVYEDHGVPPRNEGTLPKGCSRPKLPADWGPAQLCRTDYVRITAWTPTEGRYVTAYVDYEPGDAGRASRTAVSIVKDVDATLDAYDAEHAKS